MSCHSFSSRDSPNKDLKYFNQSISQHSYLVLLALLIIVSQILLAQIDTGLKITNVVFMDGATNRDVDRKLYDADYDMDYVLNNNLTQTPMIVHPAFTFGDQELTGFWVAKFEASMAEENLETTENNNVTNKTIKVLPGKESWRYIQSKL